MSSFYLLFFWLSLLLRLSLSLFLTYSLGWNDWIFITLLQFIICKPFGKTWSETETDYESLNSELGKQKQEPETAIFRQARPHYYDPFNPVQLPQFILPLSPSRFYFSKFQQNGFSTETFPLKHLQSAIQLFFGLAKWKQKFKSKQEKKRKEVGLRKQLMMIRGI